MKITAVIAEYNPFHNGHAYHLEQTKKITESDFLIAVMSGNYVQRGTPAIYNKYLRTKMALLGGADVVIELPTLYSLSSAEYFAGGGITLLNQLGVVDYLSFGSEYGEVSSIVNIAEELLKKEPAYSVQLLAKLKRGLSYPEARQQALLSYEDFGHERDLALLLSSPNNILGLEYCKSIIATKSNITPVTIRREDSSYHEDKLSTASEPFSSATSIRKAILEGNTDYNKHLPYFHQSLFEQEAEWFTPISENDFSSVLHFKLLSEANRGYQNYLDCSEDISNRILNNLKNFTCFEEFCHLLKTKNNTYTRISRVLMHILLNITEPAYFRTPLSNRDLFVPYARLLGFRQNATLLLSAIKNNSSIPLLSKPADAQKLLSDSAYAMLQRDICCSQIYEAVRFHKYKATPLNEFKCSPIVVSDE